MCILEKSILISVLEFWKTHMTRELTLQLPEDLFHKADSMANLSGFAIDEFIEKLLRAILRPAQTVKENRAFVQRLFSYLSDDDIAALANLQMERDKLDLFEQLLAAQKEKEITQGDFADLDALGSEYDRSNLLKSYAMIEAARRNLMMMPA